MASANVTMRGSRAWFEAKLNAIEASGGKIARALAVDKWKSIAWTDTCEADFLGADWLDRIHRLTDAMVVLKDNAAVAKIKTVLLCGDDAQIIHVDSLLNKKKIRDAIRAQGMDESRIRELSAAMYESPDEPRRHHCIRRRLRTKVKQAVATLNMTLGVIGKGGHNHVTPFELTLRNQQKVSWMKFGESVTLNRNGEEVSMLAVMKSSSKKKLAEIYALTKGLESYATEAGLSWAFMTLTAPPRMHPNPAVGKNQWDGTNPDEAHAWIRDAYHRAEARLRKKGVVISGLRVVEPHKDGCPHWHALIFAHANDMATIDATFRQQVEWETERSLKFVLGNGCATAASYCFKYILTTVNSIETQSGEVGRIDAWRSTWGIRSFQWFGMPRVQLWRNLRAIKDCPTDALLAGLWRAAHRGDGHAFIGLSGGLNVKSRNRTVASKTTHCGQMKTISFNIRTTGECIKFDTEKWVSNRNEKMERAVTSQELKLSLIIQERPKHPHPASALAPRAEVTNAKPSQVCLRQDGGGIHQHPP
jgi:hypothetical protein